jgi:hypothetical protein
LQIRIAQSPRVHFHLLAILDSGLLAKIHDAL